MPLDASYYVPLASDYLTAYGVCWPGAVATREGLVIAMSVAEHETNNGRAWPGQNNFGAVQLRSLTPQELEAFEAGTLKAGDYTLTRDGCLRVDTHPGPNGPIPYPMWFAAFPTRPLGIAHFLRVLWRLSDGAPDADGATCATVAEAMFVRGYFEGTHHGARPVGQRVDPLTAPEAANVADYAGAVHRCYATIFPLLVTWAYQTPADETPEPPAVA
jgi:hypothetical protein